MAIHNSNRKKMSTQEYTLRRVSALASCDFSESIAAFLSLNWASEIKRCLTEYLQIGGGISQGQDEYEHARREGQGGGGVRIGQIKVKQTTKS